VSHRGAGLHPHVHGWRMEVVSVDETPPELAGQRAPDRMRTGKKLAAGSERVAIVFKAPDVSVGTLPPGSNALIFDLAGSGALRLLRVTKKPGPELIPAVTRARPSFL